MADKPEDHPHFAAKKKVDESWKDAVQKEKGKVPGAAPRPKGEAPSDNRRASASAAPGGFAYFLSTLGMQTLAALGEVEDPMSGAVHADLQQAQYLIDVLHMLAEKTKGNLTPEEETMMENLLYELRVKFVEKSRPPQ